MRIGDRFKAELEVSVIIKLQFCKTKNISIVIE